jgi:O-antigen/teichoic acid export membrane protein
MSKNFLKDFSIYGIGGIVSRFVGVITAPIYTRMLSTEGYGLLDLIMSISAILIIFTTMEMHSGYARSYYEAKDKNQLKQLRGTIMMYFVVSYFFLLAVFFLLYPHLNQWINLFDISLLIPVVLQLLPTSIITLTLITIQFEKKPVLYSLIIISNLLLTAVGGIFAVTYLDLGVSGILWSNAIVSFIVVFILFIVLFKYTRFNFNMTYLKETALYSMPIMPARISTWVNQYIGRIFIVSALSLNMLGVYSIALKIGLLMTLAVGAFKQTWSPMANKLFTQEGSESKFVIILNYYLLCSFALVVLIVVASPLIIRIIAPFEFYRATSFVGLIAVSAMWDGITNIVASGNAWERKTYYNTYGSLTAASISIVLLYLFIDQGGIIIVTLILVLAALIKSGINLMTSQRNHPMPYSYSNIIITVMISVLFAFISHFLYDSSQLFNVWQSSMILLAVGAIVLFFMDRIMLNGKSISKVLSYIK